MHFSLKFLKELALYEEVQPYRLYDFPELSQEQQTNCVFETVHGVSAQSLRDIDWKPSIANEGFEFVKAPTRCSLAAAVFESERAESKSVLDDYLRETMNLVHS